MADLVHLGPDHLLLVVGLRQQHLQDVKQAPEGLLLIQEEQRDGGDPVEALAVLDVWVVKTVGQQDSS